jgi:murein DD-endopeptidase MepM/ murein hydrolase activator NlpD
MYPPAALLCSLGLLFGSPVQAREDESLWLIAGEYIYALPYACVDDQDHRVMQGYGGKYSHQSRSRYSLDFMMQSSTPVHAARGGTVQQVKEQSNVGGADPKYRNRANLVRIAHTDSTYAEYLHLAHQGVVVAEDESVVRGQLIAYSGMTGYTAGPHLHFSVTTTAAHRAPSQAVRFFTRRGVVTLEQGVDYEHPECSQLP